jgi:hypothetical protein
LVESMDRFKDSAFFWKKALISGSLLVLYARSVALR